MDLGTVIMDQFQDSQTDKKHQCLDPETDGFCQFPFLTQKLTLWARGTL